MAHWLIYILVYMFGASVTDCVSHLQKSPVKVVCAVHPASLEDEDMHLEFDQCPTVHHFEMAYRETNPVRGNLKLRISFHPHPPTEEKSSACFDAGDLSYYLRKDNYYLSVIRV